MDGLRHCSVEYSSLLGMPSNVIYLSKRRSDQGKVQDRCDDEGENAFVCSAYFSRNDVNELEVLATMQLVKKRIEWEKIIWPCFNQSTKWSGKRRERERLYNDFKLRIHRSIRHCFLIVYSLYSIRVRVHRRDQDWIELWVSRHCSLIALEGYLMIY